MLKLPIKTTGFLASQVLLIYNLSFQIKYKLMRVNQRLQMIQILYSAINHAFITFINKSVKTVNNDEL